MSDLSTYCPKRLRCHAMRILSLGIYLAMTTFRINGPLVRTEEGHLMEWGRYARSLVRFGYLRSGLAPLDVDGLDIEAHPASKWRHHSEAQHFSDRPVLPPLVLSFVFRVFGEGEAQIRGTLVVVGAAAIVAFYLFAVAFACERIASVATLIFALMPMFSYYSIVVYHLTFALFFSLVALNGYWRWYQGAGRKWLIVCVSATFLACQSDWPAYFVILVLSVHCGLTRRASTTRCLLAVLAGVLVFCLHVIHMAIVEPGAGSSVLTVLSEELTIFAEEPWTWFKSESKEVFQNAGVGAVVLAGVGAVVCGRRRERSDLLLLLLPLFALDEILFASFAVRHPSLTMTLTPAVSLLAAVGLVWLWNTGRVAQAGVTGLVVVWVVHTVSVAYPLFTTPKATNLFVYRLGQSIRREAQPNERVFVATYYLPRSIGYYADRYTDGRPAPVYYGPVPKDVLDGWIQKLRRNESGFDVAVAAKKDGFFREQADLKTELDRFSEERKHSMVQQFCIDEGDDPLVATLEEIAVRKWDASGFRFYRLRR